MRIRAGCEISFECPAPTPMLLMLNVHPSRRDDLETPDEVRTSPPTALKSYRDLYGNICGRLLAPAGRFTLSTDFVIRDDGRPDEVPADAEQLPVEALPDDVVLFLLGSRYCETDRMMDLAWSLFGAAEPGWARAQAIVDYAHQRIGFSYEHARPTRSAWDAHEERMGVCRDYAHLAITLCRCMNIPARYCTGYLGDIGVEPSDAAMDFSAWLEVYLGGRWRTMDARHNVPRIGRVLMARGRDATDVAISTNFGPAELVGFKVVTEEIPRAISVTAGSGRR